MLCQVQSLQLRFEQQLLGGIYTVLQIFYAYLYGFLTPCRTLSVSSAYHLFEEWVCRLLIKHDIVLEFLSFPLLSRLLFPSYITFPRSSLYHTSKLFIIF